MRLPATYCVSLATTARRSSMMPTTRRSCWLSTAASTTTATTKATAAVAAQVPYSVPYSYRTATACSSYGMVCCRAKTTTTILLHCTPQQQQSLSSSSFSTTTTTTTSNDDNNNSSSSTADVDFGQYYQIEASNAERSDATKLTVLGPNVDGILASMTVNLAVQGCSLIELHAAASGGGSGGKSSTTSAAIGDSCTHQRQHHHAQDTEHFIKDVFYVVNRQTGRQFDNHELADLAKGLLEAAKSPLRTAVSSKRSAVVGGGNDDNEEDDTIAKHNQLIAYLEAMEVPKEQITIIPSIASPSGVAPEGE